MARAWPTGSIRVCSRSRCKLPGTALLLAVARVLHKLLHRRQHSGGQLASGFVQFIAGGLILDLLYHHLSRVVDAPAMITHAAIPGSSLASMDAM